MRLRRLLAGGAAVALAGGAALVLHEQPARSADHLDAPATKADHTVDIADHYAWMDGNNMILVMTSNPTTAVASDAGPATKFSNVVQYVFHTNSGASYGAVPIAYNIICTFNAAQTIQCWGGTDEYVTGDASVTTGIASADGKFRVYAGPRADPFFFNLDGFNAVRADVIAALPALAPTENAAGCPVVNGPTSTVLVNQLKSAPDGGTPQDFFANLNELAIVVAIDKSLVTKGGPVVASWVSTNK